MEEGAITALEAGAAFASTFRPTHPMGDVVGALLPPPPLPSAPPLPRVGAEEEEEEEEWFDGKCNNKDKKPFVLVTYSFLYFLSGVIVTLDQGERAGARGGGRDGHF